MLTLFTVLHILLCVFMVFVILLQPGKDAGMGAGLGGGAATSAFGGRGAVTVLSKVTGVCATLFFITSLGLSFVGLENTVAADLPASAPTSTPPAAGGGSPATPPAAQASGDAPAAPAAPAQVEPANPAETVAPPATGTPVRPPGAAGPAEKPLGQ